MSASPDPIQEILGPDGSLARSLEDFEFRPSQLQMARLTDKVLERKSRGILEAGTGTGKTLGYLVPIVLSRKKTVISTGTKNLQEQIFFKDIPLLSRSTGFEVNAMLMKGRKNYLCLYRYHQHFSKSSLLRLDQEKLIEKIDKWLRKTEFADRAELSWLKDDDPIWDALSSTSDQCLGLNCIYAEDCYLNSLRRKAARSRIIIVNHHLFFADLAIKSGGFGEIIPRFQVVIFDEAHKIEEIATTYFGESVSTSQLMGLVSDMERESKNLKEKKNKNIERHLDLIRTGAERLRELFNGYGDKGRLGQGTRQLINERTGNHIRKGLGYIQEKPGLEELESGSFHGFATRARDLNESLAKILDSYDPNWLNWFEKRKKTVVLHASPLDISQHMKEFLYQKRKTIVFTSATLSTNGNFEYIKSRLGLSDVLEGIYPSHFDFERQALMYIPRDLAPPNDPSFGEKVGKRVLDILEISAGRALVLFTSYHNLNRVHQLLRGKIPYTIFKQGDAPKSVLLQEFRRDTHSVLLATGSFWQGVDVPGEALSCLIIDKLPFDSPGEPLIAARIESIHARGGNPFMEYQLPSAIISLKQGLGRLIRSASDHGILAILDSRMITSRYGRFFFHSLPEMPLTHELSEIETFFVKENLWCLPNHGN